ncbi:MAG TPA: hypothetical protein PLX35_17460 [Cyclobacteriaceae bacterium]|nr:hypothetical protein [Cyclobacteriaceae bacterium]
MPLTLSRIILFGHQLGKLKSFYVDHFGFSVVEEIPDQWIVLKARATELALHKVGREYEPSNGQPLVGVSNAKLVFTIADGIETFGQRLAADGIEIGPVKSFPGIPSLFCDGKDPEGNVFQIEQRLG